MCVCKKALRKVNGTVCFPGPAVCDTMAVALRTWLGARGGSGLGLGLRISEVFSNLFDSVILCLFLEVTAGGVM